MFMRSAKKWHRMHKYLIFVLVSVFLTGCASTKVLDEPVALETTKAIGEISDDRINLILDWVIFRNGPGTWASGADWDEYLVRVENRSQAPVILQNSAVVDRLATALNPGLSRQELIQASRDNVERYEGVDMPVKPGEGSTTMMVSGGVALVGAGTALAVSATQAFFTAGAAGGTAASIGGGLLVVGPALVVGGYVRKSNQREVNREIRRRRSRFPIELAPGEETLLHLFFPIAPSPQTLRLEYYADQAVHEIELDTSASMQGLHLEDDS